LVRALDGAEGAEHENAKSPRCIGDVRGCETCCKEGEDPLVAYYSVPALRDRFHLSQSPVRVSVLEDLLRQFRELWICILPAFGGKEREEASSFGGKPGQH
jgi:hypothetical protein